MRSSAATTQRRPVGRPTSYRQKYCDLIVEAMSTGLSAEAAAAEIGISARSLFNWQHRHPEFLQAIQEGRQRSLLWWEKRALEMASGEPGNTQIVVLGLRNRSRAAHGWNNDTVKVEHTGVEGQPAQLDKRNVIDVGRLDEDQRQQLRALLLAAGPPDTDEQNS